jgi:hypothetical protein
VLVEELGDVKAPEGEPVESADVLGEGHAAGVLKLHPGVGVEIRRAAAEQLVEADVLVGEVERREVS